MSSGTPSGGEGSRHVPVDIKEVARRSGVSMATVSRALNGRPDVSDETRARVADVARELGYLPNQPARALVRRRSDTVGLIWDTTYVAMGGRVPFLQDLLIGLKMALADTGYHLMLISPKAADESSDAFVRVAAQHSLDGVVLMGVDQNKDPVTTLIRTGLPVVGFDLPVRGPRASYVSTDNRLGGATAARYLAGLGHTRIAVITGPDNQLPSVERRDGFVEAMADLGLDLPADYIRHGDFFLPSGHERMQDLLALPVRPTAVFVAGDNMAIGAMRAISEAGLRVPADISIVGFDDVEVSSMVQPALTTIRQDYLAMGSAAVGMLSELIAARQAGEHTDETGPPPKLLRGELVERDSSAPLRLTE
jgi:LacI family transcriptional regulator